MDFNGLDAFHFFDLFTIINIGDDSFFERFDEKILNLPNIEGWTLLMYACNSGNFEFVDYLMKKGAFSYIKSPDNKTPLALAVGSGDLRSVKAVFSLDALEVADGRGWTPLFYAAFYGREACAEFLLQKGANPHALDKTGRTPIALAANFGMDSMVAVLLRGGQCSKTPQQDKALHSNRSKSTPRRSLNFFKSTRTFSPNTNPLKKNFKENASPIQCKSKILTFVTPQKKIHFPPKITIVKPRQTIVTTPLKENLLTDSPKLLILLTEIGMERYWKIFQQEEVDFETFITFDEENLKEVGIHLYGPRRKMLMAIQEFKAMHGNGSRLLKNARWMK